MKKLKILITNLDTINHNYGSQAIAFPLAEKLKEKFNAELSFLVGQKFVKGNTDFFKKQGWGLVVEPNSILALAKLSKNYQIKAKIREIVHIFKGQKKQIKKEKEILLEFEKKLSEIDLIIDANGIEFVGDTPGNKKFAQAKRVGFIQELAQKNNQKYLKYTKSYGPFEGRSFRALVRKYLNRLPFVMVRTGENYVQVKALNLKPPIYSFPDISLALIPAKSDWAKTYLIKRKVDPRKPIFGISPSAVIASQNSINSSGANHITLCINLINEFAKKEQIIILPHALGDEKNPARSDLVLSRRIYEYFKDSKNVFLFDDTTLTYPEVRAIIGEMDFYVAGRFHAISSALFMSVPVVPLAWHIKYHDIMGLFIDRFPIIEAQKESIAKAFNLVKKYKQNQGWFDKMKLAQRKKQVLIRIEQSFAPIERFLNES